jgi:hypothetical protein
MERSSTNRPILISAVCLIGFIGAIIIFPTVFTIDSSQRGSWFVLYFALTILVGATSLVGLWQMKKWGLYLYASMALINQIVLTLEGRWDTANVVMPSIVILIGFHYHAKLT